MNFLKDTHLSITKGCFVHKKDTKKKKKKTRESSRDDVFNNEQRQNLWKTMEKEIKEIEKDAYRTTVDSIVKFVSDYHKSASLGIKEIPTAVLVMDVLNLYSKLFHNDNFHVTSNILLHIFYSNSVNMPDHSNIFQLLEQEINRNGIPSTIVLQSRDCNNLSSMLQRTILGLMKKYKMEMELDDVHLKRHDCTFAKFLSWCKIIAETEALAASPHKKSKIEEPQCTNIMSKPMVLLIQDVEAFHREVLQEFILCCNMYVNQLPIVLVFGVASAMVTLHNLLSQKALSCLASEIFYSLTATEYLTKILQKVVMSPCHPFKLGPRVFKLLVDVVLYHDFSVINLIRILKFSMIEHFYSNKLSSVLCCSLSEVKKQVQSMSSEQLEFLREIASVKSFIQSNPESKLAAVEESEFKVAIIDHLEKLHSYHSFMITLLTCLHTLTHDLPGYPFGKQLREVYMIILENQVTDTPNYTQAEKLLGMCSKEELERKLTSVLETVKKVRVDESDGFLCSIEEKLQELIDLLNSEEDSREKKSSTFKESLSSDKITNRFQLQEKLRSRLKARKLSHFENCRQAVLDYFRSIFKHLIPPSKMILHEVLYFNNATSLKKHLLAAPRYAVHRALVNPHQYLQCRCCKISEGGQVLPSMPDLSVLYKLHTEYGRLINLCDWLEAFKSIKLQEVEKSRKKLSCKHDENISELEIRFVQAVSELQLLGFIKSTRRKTDHVARLTFGKL